MKYSEILQNIHNSGFVRKSPVIELSTAKKCFLQIADELANNQGKKYDSQRLSRVIDLLISWCYQLEGSDLNFQKGILLKGKTGRGKTFLFKVLRQFMLIDELCYSLDGKLYFLNPVIVNVRTIAGEYQQPDGGYNTIRKYATKPCLCIDDIGCESEIQMSFGNKTNVVEEIIATREDLGLVTFGTTNLETFSKMYDDRTISRMSNLFNVIVVEHDVDYRRK